jgi:GTP-binding protein of the ras superfamily involved in termination of M-phase
MMPMVCVDAVAMLFLFDLTNPSTLTSVREWYRQVRGLNKVRLMLERGSRADNVRRDSRGAADVQSAIPFLIGTKYDIFYTYERNEQDEIIKQVRRCRGVTVSQRHDCAGHHTWCGVAWARAVRTQARRFAHAMKAPLIFCSSFYGINVQKLFKIAFSKVFDVKCSVPPRSEPGEPLIEY